MASEEGFDYWAELSMRMMLKLPSEPLIMYLESSWRPSKFPDAPWVNFPAPYFKNAQALFGHQKIAMYYQIPIVLVFEILFPVHLYNQVVDDLNGTIKKDFYQDPPGRTGLVYGLRDWYSDCCHPKHIGHQFMAILLANTIYSEMMTNEQREKEYPIRKRAGDQLPDPWFIGKADEDKYGWTPLMVWRFDGPQVDAAFYEMSNANGSKWSHYAETRQKKWGLIASEQNAHLAVNISVQTSVYVSFMKTYENIGKVAVWINDEKNGDLNNCIAAVKEKKMLQSGGNQTAKLKVGVEEYVILDEKWDHHLSILHAQEIVVRRTVKQGRATFLHFCLVTKEKFKLLQIISY